MLLSSSILFLHLPVFTPPAPLENHNIKMYGEFEIAKILLLLVTHIYGVNRIVSPACDKVWIEDKSADNRPLRELLL